MTWSDFPAAAGSESRPSAGKMISKIPFFNQKENAVLELKTKSDRVENLLNQNSSRNVIVSWSLNPQTIIDQATFAKPTEKAAGIDLVMVNGRTTWNNNGPTGYRPGRVIRRENS